MKKLFVFFSALLLAFIIVFTFAACNNDPTDKVDPDLSGVVSLSPETGGSTGTELIASYSGSETVTFQWNRNGSIVPGATKNAFTPFISGSYSVTASAFGYKSKTSADVQVSASGSLSGSIAITPDSGVAAGMKLTAVYVPAAGEEGLTFSFQWKLNGNIIGGSSNEYIPYAGGNFTVTAGAADREGKTSSAVAVTGNSGAINDPIQITVDSSFDLDYSKDVPSEKALISLIAEATAGTPGFISLDLSEAAGGDIWNWDTLYNRNEGRFTANELDKSKIVHLIIPDSVTRTGGKNNIWRFTFGGHDYPNLKTLLARNVTLVGEASFQNTAAELIDLPKAEVFEDYCFYDYQKGFTINMPMVKHIGNQAFQHLKHDDPRLEVGSTEPITITMGMSAPTLGIDMFKDNRGLRINIRIPEGASGYSPIHGLYEGNPITFGGNYLPVPMGSWVNKFRVTTNSTDVPGRVVSFERSN